MEKSTFPLLTNDRCKRKNSISKANIHGTGLRAFLLYLPNFSEINFEYC